MKTAVTLSVVAAVALVTSGLVALQAEAHNRRSIYLLSDADLLRLTPK